MSLVFLDNQNMLYMQQFHWRTRFLHNRNFWELLPNHHSERSISRLISLRQSTHNAILGSKRDSFMNIAWLSRYQRKSERLKEAWQQNLGLDLFNGKFKGKKASWNKLSCSLVWRYYVENRLIKFIIIYIALCLVTLQFKVSILVSG